MRRRTIVLLALVVAAATAAAANAAAPANDNFTAAEALTGDAGVVGGTNVEATAEIGEPQHWDSGGGHSVWYRWTAPSDGPVTFDTCTTSFDTVLAVYTGSALAALSRVDASDDACAAGSRVSFTAASGTDYRVAVDGYGAASGTFSLAWRRVPAAPVVLEWPVVSGTRVDGSTLTVSSGRWSGAEPIAVTYRWRRCHTGCVEIAGATGETYRLTAADVGFTLIADVTATNAGGPTTVQAWAGPIAAAPPRADAEPVIEGTPLAGHSVAVAHSSWSGTPPITVAFQWQRCGSGRDLANAALNRPARASRSFPANPPAMAVDADIASWWGAGAFAPNWIEIDLGAPTPIAELRLYASQTPAGLTAHRVYGRLSGTTERLLHEFGGTTADGEQLRQRLEFEMSAQFIRVETILSPSWVSWREVEVLTRCRDLPGRTGVSYVPRIADIGATLRLVVRASNATGTMTVASYESLRVRGCVVPRVTGTTVRAARVALRRHGCRLGRISRDFSAGPAGRIVRQALPVGARRLFAARVNVVVGA